MGSEDVPAYRGVASNQILGGQTGKKIIYLPGGQINDPFYLPFIPATPSTLEGLKGFKGPRLASCIASGTTEIREGVAR